MRLERDLVHPSIFSATDVLNRNYWSTGTYGANPENQRLMMIHQAEWWKSYGTGYLLRLGAMVTAMILTGIFTFPHAPKPFRVLYIMGCILASIGHTAFELRRNSRELTARELQVILPALEITPIQRAYSEALVALSEANLDNEAYRATVLELNRLLDEEGRLISLRDPNLQGPASVDDVQGEIDAIKARLETATDEVTRRALTQSLEIADSRLKFASQHDSHGSRIDAQLELIAQAVRGVRDSVLRAKSAPKPSLAFDVEAIRQRVDAAYQHSQAMDQAILEVQSISTSS